MDQSIDQFHDDGGTVVLAPLTAPTEVSETIGKVTLTVKTGEDSASYKDGESFSHLEVWLTLGDANPVIPSACGLKGFDQYFAPNGHGAYVSAEIVKELRQALRILSAS